MQPGGAPAIKATQPHPWHRPTKPTGCARTRTHTRTPPPLPTYNARLDRPSDATHPSSRLNARATQAHHLHTRPNVQQRSFFKPQPKQHGGSLAPGKRRARRPLSTKEPLHITLKSEIAEGRRSLKRYKADIERIATTFAKRFNVQIYEYAICATHIHLLVRGKQREGLQNFFRVFAGHIAQKILQDHPLSQHEDLSRDQRQCEKNQRKFWSYLLYSRVMTWGREFVRVRTYIKKNVLESLYKIAYEPRARRRPP